MTDTALLALANAGQDLTEEETLILAEMQADDAAFDLQPARVKIAPGGIGKFLLGDEAAKEFVAVVAISQKIRGYWPDQGSGNPPLCSSPDGTWGFFDQEPSDAQFQAATASKTPHPGVILLTNNEPLPQRFSCARCPLNQWGSEHQRRSSAGRGKACKEMRRLLLLIDGWTLPALMSLPPTSIRSWDGYCSALAAKRSAYFAVRTRFSLDTAKASGGETYNVVQVEVAEKINDLAQLKAIGDIRQRYRELVTMPVDASEYEVRDAAPDKEEIPF
ncbi:hypothetical protein [Caldilinea sp.]|uniref:hypothetical protein n=1 Tax=Caldilinea sp. TaxID=2293560 RepID=UPI0021DBB091|nr:hypothetical protein [Caldilinea sp.]GIV73505.1 MAG: hypothetical protein KatS3mg049_2061 [Caldilinea sp.]